MASTVDRHDQETVDMQSIITPIIGFLGLGVPQYIAIAALIGLLIFYMQYKKKNM